MAATIPICGLDLADEHGRPSVLLVDDYRDGVDSLAQLLRLTGYLVRVAYHPDDALAADTPDVVVLELRLPGLSGCELVRRMRARTVGRQPLYVAVTTCGSPTDRRQAAEAGVDLHLVKPADPQVLLEVLELFIRARWCRTGRGGPPLRGPFGPGAVLHQ